MITKLNELTVDQFIDLVCGKVNVILAKGELKTPEQIAIAVRNIIIEYRDIADPGDVAGFVRNIEEWLKARLGVVLWTMASNLVTLQYYDKARAVLNLYGLPADAWNEKRLEGEVKSRLTKAERALEELETEREKHSEEVENVRSQFDGQTAALMAHFRFQIDTTTMKAPVYAHLVARQRSEIKAQMKSMKKN